MLDLAEALRIECEKVTNFRTYVEQHLQQYDDVEGKLRIVTRNNQVSYYHRLPHGKPNGEYIRKEESNLANKLAQKSYDEKVLKLAIKREKQFQDILRDYQTDEIEQLYLKENKHRQTLITPVEPTWMQIVEEWKQKPYDSKPFTESDPLILTNRGERVRSKTERAIANYFDQNQIPYKYECPLFLPPYGIVYPDFTILSKRTREEIYWEHEGKMDDPNYAKKAVKKIHLYQSNNILVGERLILTFETGSSVLNIDIIQKLVNQYCL